jgi:hypothetical protein
MRKFFYVLLGIVLIGGAVAAFGAREFGWEPSAMTRSERGDPAPRSAMRNGGGGDRHAVQDRGVRRRDGIGLNFSTLLDLVNVLVGVIGIVLTISGMRMQRNAMQMSMRNRD